jgi:pimeloyl-ACP methyl ester carboxylesterase
MGADYRLFEQIKLPEGRIHHLDWRDPGEAKTLTEYAAMIAPMIEKENSILIGSSMGGMLAVELSKLINPDAVILLSAPVYRSQFPRILKMTAAIRIYKLFNSRSIMFMSRLADVFMGFEKREDRTLFYEMLHKNGGKFLRFAVEAVLLWDNGDDLKCPWVQIIGDRDKLFPPNRMSSPLVIRNGGHFTTWEQPQQCSEAIEQWLLQKFPNDFETK